MNYHVFDHGPYLCLTIHCVRNKVGKTSLAYYEKWSIRI